jgi:hypothetical protein
MSQLTLNKKDLEQLAMVVDTLIDKRLAKAGNNTKVKEKRTPKEAKDLLPYGHKSKVLKALKPTELKEIISKSDYFDKGFNLKMGEMIKFFKAHNLGGRPWITYEEQIDYFIIPLKDEYKPSKTQWGKKIKLMKGEVQTKLIDAETKLKENEKQWTDGRIKAQQYRIQNLTAIQDTLLKMQ